MHPTVYAYAALQKVGLGNMLFPWARAEVFAHRHGVPMLAPRWTHAKVGPILRREKDKRFYVGLFDNRRAGYVRGLRRLLALRLAGHIDEAQAEAFMQGPADRSGTTIVSFKGYEKWFAGLAPHHDLMPHRDLVCRRLAQIIATAHQRTLARSPTDFVIAAHVRRGDKPTMQFMEPYPGDDERGIPQHHRTLADQWYINCITSIRAALGSAAPVRLFSDAKDEQLAPLLALPGVSRAPDNPSIVDMFMLSRARVLVTTGTSSFSAWASYLGGMPTIWYPGLCVQLNPRRPSYGIETDLSGTLPPSAAAVLRAATAPG